MKNDEDYKNVLIVFYASWCSKCKILDREIKLYNNKDILKIDADKNRDICKKYGVMTLPTLISFDENGNFKKYIGLNDALDYIKK